MTPAANVPKELTETFRFGGGDATATLRFEVIDGAVILTAITTTGGLPVTEALDRLGSIEERGREAVVRWLRGELFGILGEGAHAPGMESFVQAVAATPTARRKNRLTPEHFRAVAKVYLDAEPTGQPTKTVAEHFGCGRSTAAHWVMRARRDGYLPETNMVRERDPNTTP